MKILIIENDFISRSYLRELFSYCGYQCLTAYNATVGLDTYMSQNPDVIVCNMFLPGMSGLEFLQQIRKTDQKTIVILISSRTSERLAIQAFRLGANDFLKKPVQDNDILPILQRISSQLENLPKPFVYGQIEEGKVVFTFNTEIDAPHNIVRRLINEINPEFFGEDELISIEIGLSELVTNAVEHGNLNISFQEKSQAMDTNSLSELYESRISDQRFSGRLVTVTYEFNQEECRWTIADEGDGFDISKVPDPTDSSNIEELHGRGIFMTRLFFDSLDYIGNGNQCVAVKKRNFLI